jgi:hypothetical protein
MAAGLPGTGVVAVAGLFIVVDPVMRSGGDVVVGLDWAYTEPAVPRPTASALAIKNRFLIGVSCLCKVASRRIAACRQKTKRGERR